MPLSLFLDRGSVPHQSDPSRRIAQVSGYGEGFVSMREHCDCVGRLLDAADFPRVHVAAHHVLEKLLHRTEAIAQKFTGSAVRRALGEKPGRISLQASSVPITEGRNVLSM